MADVLRDNNAGGATLILSPNRVEQKFVHTDVFDEFCSDP
jgi:hypothetical protein